MSNTEAKLYVQEGLDRRKEERCQNIRLQQQKEAERREDLMEVMFLEQISNRSKMNRLMAEQSQAVKQPPQRRPSNSERRRREAEEEAEMRSFKRRAKIGYSVIGHVIIIIVLAFALNDGLMARELVTPFSCCVCLIFGFDAGRIWNEMLNFFNQPSRKPGDL